jgi:hypothetical protein
VAKLAFSILTCLRSQDRSRYSSESQLLEFLRSDGVAFATKDVNPALTLLESMDMLIRPPVPPNIARPGWLPTSADGPVPVPVLIDAIIRVLGAGLCGSEEDLQARLDAAGVAFHSQDLNIAISRLVDSGRLMRPKPRPTEEFPNPPRSLVMANLPRGLSQSGDRFDHIDSLAADVHASVKKRSDRFESDEQLQQWLTEDGIEWTVDALRDAVEQLEVSGWLSRPHRSRDWHSDPLPGYLVSPSWMRGW